MKRLTSRILIGALAALVASGCASQRPVEQLEDPDKERLEKSTFLGTSIGKAPPDEFAFKKGPF